MNIDLNKLNYQGEHQLTEDEQGNTLMSPLTVKRYLDETTGKAYQVDEKNNRYQEAPRETEADIPNFGPWQELTTAKAS